MALLNKRKFFIEVHLFRFFEYKQLEVQNMAIMGKKDKLAVRPTEEKKS